MFVLPKCEDRIEQGRMTDNESLGGAALFKEKKWIIMLWWNVFCFFFECMKQYIY